MEQETELRGVYIEMVWGRGDMYMGDIDFVMRVCYQTTSTINRYVYIWTRAYMHANVLTRDRTSLLSSAACGDN